MIVPREDRPVLGGKAPARIARLLFLVISNDQFLLHRSKVLFVLLGDRFVKHVRLVGLLLEQWPVVQHPAKVRESRLVVDLVAQFGLMHLPPDVQVCRGASTSNHVALQVKLLGLADADMVEALVARSYAQQSLSLLKMLHCLLADFQLLAHILDRCPVHIGRRPLVARVHNHKVQSSLLGLCCSNLLFCCLPAFGNLSALGSADGRGSN